MENEKVMGKDGLLHCSVCGDAIEKVLDLSSFGSSGESKKMKVHVMCTCERMKKLEFDSRMAKEEDMRRIEGLRKLSLMDEKFQHARLSTFTETYENTKLIKIVKNYIINFNKLYDENRGLLLYGPVGTGKSYAAAVIANELLEEKVSVVMTSFIKILKAVGTFESNNGKIEKINRSKLLIIDDLGAERGTDYALEMVYDIIDSRYRCNKPIILTTNLTIEQMKNCEDIRYNRIYDRIFEMCYPVNVTGLSWRKREAAARFKETKKILEE